MKRLEQQQQQQQAAANFVAKVDRCQSKLNSRACCAGLFVCHMPQNMKTKKKVCKGLNKIKCCKLFKVIRFAVNQQAIKVKATPNKKL